jgi:hypothetical protein
VYAIKKINPICRKCNQKLSKHTHINTIKNQDRWCYINENTVCCYFQGTKIVKNIGFKAFEPLITEKDKLPVAKKLREIARNTELMV